MAPSIYNSAATVVLPAGGRGNIRSPDMRRWLGRTDLTWTMEAQSTLSRVKAALGHDAGDAGEGALRLWGQTGDRPTVWLAAADPVYLEARLDHLCLHHLSGQDVSPKDLGEFFDGLQTELGRDDEFGFVHLGSCGYIRGQTPMPTARLSADCLHGREPSPYMPTGGDADRYHRIHSEIQMTLHLSDLQKRRAAAGLRPVNALWIWGGGSVPEVAPRAIPPLFADDALLRGYWNSVAGTVRPWTGNLLECAEASPEGFVAVVPHVLRRSHDGMDALSAHLSALRDILNHSQLRRLNLLFQDGISALVRRRHAFRIWRRSSTQLEAQPSS